MGNKIKYWIMRRFHFNALTLLEIKACELEANRRGISVTDACCEIVRFKTSQ